MKGWTSYMYSSRVWMSPLTSGIGDELLEAFTSMWKEMDSVSRLPGCLITGDFPPTDVMADEEDNYVIRMAVAGYPEENISLNFKDDYLTVSLVPEENKYKNYKVKMVGIKNCKAERRIYVPSSKFAADKVEASVTNGMLTILIPRKEETKPISIKVATK